MNKILIVKDLKKYFIKGNCIVRAVNGVSFDIRDKEIFAIIGESGSGKSTLGFSILGAYKPTSGVIIYKEQYNINIESSKRSQSLKKEIQIVFQDPGSSLNPMHTIRTILELPLKIYETKKYQKNIEETILNLLKIIKIPNSYLEKHPSMLSLGEKQRVSIARALAGNPSLIVLDEPTSSLDVSVQANIINELLNIKQKLKLTYLFISHDLCLIRNIADRVAIMYLGKISEIAPTDIFFKNPMHPYTLMLLSSIQVITQEEERLKPQGVFPIGEIPNPANIPSGCGFHPRCNKCMDICV